MNRAYFVAVAVVLLLASWFLLLDREKLPQGASSDESSYEVRGLKAMHYDEQGGHFRLESRLVTSAPGTSSIHLTRFNLRACDQQEHCWHLQAHRGILNEAKTLLRMSGAVRAEQLNGDTIFSADRMRMLWGENQYPKMIYAEGNPLRFTYAGASGDILQGSGQRMEYEVAAGLIRLFDNAVLERREGTLRGERIEYLLKREASELGP